MLLFSHLVLYRLICVSVLFPSISCWPCLQEPEWSAIWEQCPFWAEFHAHYASWGWSAPRSCDLFGAIFFLPNMCCSLELKSHSETCSPGRSVQQKGLKFLSASQWNLPSSEDIRFGIGDKTLVFLCDEGIQLTQASTAQLSELFLGLTNRKYSENKIWSKAFKVEFSWRNCFQKWQFFWDFFRSFLSQQFCKIFWISDKNVFCANHLCGQIDAVCQWDCREVTRLVCTPLIPDHFAGWGKKQYLFTSTCATVTFFVIMSFITHRNLLVKTKFLWNSQQF